MACNATAPSGRNRRADEQEKAQSAANGSEQHDNAFDRETLIKNKAQNGNKIHSIGPQKGNVTLHPCCTQRKCEQVVVSPALKNGRKLPVLGK